MPLTAVQEIYVSMTNGAVSIGGTSPNIIDGDYTLECSVDEMTNNGSLGWYEDVPTINKASGKMTIAYKTSSPPAFIQGTVYSLAIATPNGPGITGNCRVTKLAYPGVDPKKGVKVGLDWTSFGVMTKS